MSTSTWAASSNANRGDKDKESDDDENEDGEYNFEAETGRNIYQATAVDPEDICHMLDSPDDGSNNLDAESPNQWPLLQDQLHNIFQQPASVLITLKRSQKFSKTTPYSGWDHHQSVITLGVHRNRRSHNGITGMSISSANHQMEGLNGFSSPYSSEYHFYIANPITDIKTVIQTDWVGMDLPSDRRKTRIVEGSGGAETKVFDPPGRVGNVVQ
ncbi:hypothetical protein IFM89_033416, partial [Coptis chinensis]